MAVDLGEDQPLAGVEVDLALAVLLDHELRHEVDGRDLLREHAPLVEPPRRFHEEVRVALRDRARLAGRAGLELEVALVPDGEGIDRLLAAGVVELRVHDAAFEQEDLALVGPVHEVEDPRLSADADELDDVGEVELSE